MSVSWADMVRKKPDAAAAPVVKQVLIGMAPDSVPDKVQVQQTGLGDARILPPPGPLAEPIRRVVVLDTGALLRAHDVAALGDDFYTIADVVKEVRDARHRASLENLTYELKVVAPGPAALQAVIEATKATGDIGSLSRTDLRVMALAYQLAQEASCLGRVSQAVAEDAKSETDGEEEDDDGADEVLPPKVEGEEDEEDDDDDGDWITPENLHQHQVQPVGMTRRVDDSDFTALACLTIDFAMQNALLHLGIPVVGTDGRRITRLRTWVLRCHACFTIVQDTTRQFCPACGSGDTLRKVSYTIDAAGERHVWINWKRRLNTRGVRYNLPKPRWGTRGTNRTLVLREDQLKDFGKTKSARQAMKRTATDSGDVFGKTREKQSSHQGRERSSYAKFNVNERRNLRASRNK